ncbi:MAG: hypothetical protein ABW352_20920 [Polyangiales bacterium]
MRWSASLLLVMLACGDTESGPSDAGTCDPLAEFTRAAELRDVVAAGSAPDGTLYVVTRQGSDTRVFVSEGDTLVRRRVLGSGFGFGLGELSDDTVSFQDARTSRLVFQSMGDYAVRMALVHDDAKTFYDAVTSKTELTVQPESAAFARPVRNLPGEVVLEYAAITPDQQQLIVTRPKDDWTMKDFRLFLGRDDQLQELAITNAAVNAFARFDFVLNGLEGTVIVGNPTLSPGTASVVRHDNGEWPLTLLPTGSGVPGGWRIYCL